MTERINTPNLAARRLAVLSPWYPSPQRPFAGSFVRTATSAVTGMFDHVDVYHTEDWPGPADPIQAELVRSAYAKLTRPKGGRIRFAPRVTAPGLSVTRIPTPVTPKRDYADWARAHERALRTVLPDGRVDADVVHGHVGTYGGWLALRFAAPSARVVVTEHASFLGRILGQPASRAMYAEVVERADAFLCVSQSLRRELVAAFPRYADKISVVPNAVDIGSMPLRATPPTALHRWIYVGNVAATKGVPELLEAFALAAATESALRLTVLGGGPLVARLRARAAELGLAARVEFHDPVPPHRVFEFLHEADLLVHPSKFETFGMTTVEAVGSGTPVLVTRCGGPEETLAGLDGVAGRLIDVSDDPSVIVAGYRRLAGELDRLDLARARAVLTERFGTVAVARRLAVAYLGLDGDRDIDGAVVRMENA